MNQWKDFDPKRVSKDILFHEYVKNRKSIKQIAEEQRVAVGTVFNYLKKYGIETRKTLTEESIQKMREHRKGKAIGRSHTVSEEARRKISKANKGRLRNPSEYGGHTKKRNDGYIYVYLPDHPYASADGYVMEHRLVMEKHICRYVLPGEVIHHKNGNRKDNRIENLALMTSSEHMRYHMTQRYKNKREAMTY